MTRLLISTAVATLLALGGTALAQPDDHHGGPDGGAPHAGHEQAPPQGARPMGGPAPDQRAHMDQHRAAGHQAAPAAQPAAMPPAQPRGPGPGNAMRGPGQGNAMRGPGQGNAMRGPGPGNAMRGPAPGNGQHRDYSSYQRNVSAPHHYRAPSNYSRPGGWYAKRWTYGETLPSLFWTQNYWLNDYNDFGLMPPPAGTVWVRDGDDALLIDRYSGEIIQVEYGIFY